LAYTHIDRIERQLIARVPCFTCRVADAARVLQRHRSTIYRERRRNADPDGHYNSHHAQRHARQRRKPRGSVLERDGSLRHCVTEALARKLSPQQISRWLRMQYPDDPAKHISHTAIYDFIAKDKKLADASPYGGKLFKHLRCGGKRYRRKRTAAGRFCIPQRVGIESRPPQVATRQTVGHFEADTMHGARSNACLLTLVERKTRQVFIRRCPNRRAKVICGAIASAIEPLPQSLRTSITFDNGSEFAAHGQLRQRFAVDTYFANPYSAWERGSNENVNKLIRQFFPKGTNFSRITDQQVARVQDLINNRPRKCLDWHTPAEMLEREFPVALGD